LLALASLGSDDSLPRIILALFITGFGFSLFSTPNVNAMMGSVENKFLGAASSAVAITRILGQMASMVLVTLLFALFVGDLSFFTRQFLSIGFNHTNRFLPCSAALSPWPHIFTVSWRDCTP
jgi:hypothetical protein